MKKTNLINKDDDRAKAKITNCKFNSSSLYKTKFDNTHIKDTSFLNAKYQLSSFNNSKLEGVDFSLFHVDDEIFPLFPIYNPIGFEDELSSNPFVPKSDTYKQDKSTQYLIEFNNSEIEKCDFTKAELAFSKFNNTVISNSNFFRSNLFRAQMVHSLVQSKTNFRHTVLTKFEAPNTVFQSVRFDNVNLNKHSFFVYTFINS